MAQRISKKYTLNIQGVVSIDEDNNIYISIADRGDYNLAELMDAFNGNECKISVSFDEEYGVETTEELGEII
jgi:hypothetical protein